MSGCLAWNQNGRVAADNDAWPRLEMGLTKRGFFGRKSRQQAIGDIVVLCLKHSVNDLLWKGDEGRCEKPVLILPVFFCSLGVPNFARSSK